MRRLLITIAIASVALAAAPVRAQTLGDRDLASYVNPMIGTHPPGFVFPGAAVPFGMVQNSPDTRGEFAYSGYLYEDPQIQGFSLVHLSGPGVKKGGDIPLMPTVGPVTMQDPNFNGSPFDHATEDAEAGHYRVRLTKYQTDVQLTASAHAAMQQYTFPPTTQANVILDVGQSVTGVHDAHIEFSGPDEVRGFIKPDRQKRRYPVYFVARFSKPFTSTQAFNADGPGAGGWVTFDTTQEQTVTVRIGISFVDLEGARRNLEAEAPTFDFEGMRDRARAAWNEALSTVRVEGGTDLDRTSFYTALYHAQLHPNVFTDVDGRYLGFDWKVHQADGRVQYANYSGWDTYKGENQLLALIQPRRYRDMLLTLLANHREGGRLPRWGEHNTDPAHMSGDPIVPMITDGVCRGVLSRRDADALLDASIELAAKRDAKLLQLGYMPHPPDGDSSSGTGTTLEYGVADFALALLADVMGRGPTTAKARAESLRYRHVLDPATKWIRPRYEDGSWYEPFDETEQTGFQEGNSWQYSWLAPHDARGLFDRMGGDAAVIQRLDSFFSLPSEAQNNATFFGIVYRLPQYAPGNEHDIQAPWMYPFAGQPWKTMSEHRDIQRLFHAAPDGLPGNDDLGGLSGWYVFSALGFGPVTPGAPLYVLGSPTFEKATVSPAGGQRFTVEAPGTSPLTPYVTAASLGGRELGSAWLYDSSLRRGETLRLTMGDQPDTAFGSSASVRPPSASDSPLARFGCTGPGSAAGDANTGGGTSGEGMRPAPLEPGPPRAAKPRVRIRVSPARAQVGRRTRFSFAVTARRGGRTVALKGATVRFAGRRARTSGKGRAKLWATIRRPGIHRASASARGMRRGLARVRIARR